MFVKLNNDEIEKYPYTLEMFREENSNKSLPRFLNDLFLATNGVYPVSEEVKPEHDAITKKLVKIEPPIFKDKKWVTQWSIVDKSQDEMDAELAQLAAAARQQRDELLTGSDWITVKAFETATAIPVEWIDYRQALRDVSSQAAFPYTIDWPTRP